MSDKALPNLNDLASKYFLTSLAVVGQIPEGLRVTVEGGVDRLDAPILGGQLMRAIKGGYRFLIIDLTAIKMNTSHLWTTLERVEWQLRGRSGHLACFGAANNFPHSFYKCDVLAFADEFASLRELQTSIEQMSRTPIESRTKGFVRSIPDGPTMDLQFSERGAGPLFVHCGGRLNQESVLPFWENLKILLRSDFNRLIVDCVDLQVGNIRGVRFDKEFQIHYMYQCCIVVSKNSRAFPALGGRDHRAGINTFYRPDRCRCPHYCERESRSFV